MIVIGSKQNEKRLKIDNLNDLWYLSQIIEPGDTVKARTERKVTIGSKEEKSAVKKVNVTLAIEVEKIEFHKYSDALRVSGKIVEGPEDIPHGQYHTIAIEPKLIVSVTKPEWLGFQMGYIRESQQKSAEILLLLLERDEACFALLTAQGYRILSEIKGEVENKSYKDKKVFVFYDDVLKKLEDYVARHNPKKIVVASPAFYKEDFAKLIKNQELKSKIIQATCNQSGEQGIVELLKRDELHQALKEDRVSRELVLVEQLLREISIDGNYAYGKAEVKAASEAGAVAKLIVADGLIRETRQAGTYAEVAAIMKLVQHNGGELEIIESENPGGRKLDGLGGIGALLRYKIR